MRKCSYCAEEIQDEAVKCKHCGADLQVLEEEWRRCRHCGTWTLKFELYCRGCKNRFTTIDSNVQFKHGRELSVKELEIKKVPGATLKCPKCGYEAPPLKFPSAMNELVCIGLVLIMVLPAILYYFLRTGKKICPDCGNVF